MYHKFPTHTQGPSDPNIVAPPLQEPKLTKPQRKLVHEISKKMLQMLQTPVSQPYSSSDSSSVILLGKLPSSQKKNSGAEQKSAADDNRSSEMKSSIMSIGSFGEELNKLRSNLAERDELDKLRTQLANERERQDKEKGEGGSEFPSSPINFDSDLFKVMKGSMKLNVRPSAPSTIVTAAKSNNKEIPTVNKSAREKEICEQKSESNKKSHGSTKNEASCSCPSDAEP